MEKFDVFTFQLSTLPVVQQSLFSKPIPFEELYEKKNEYFNEIFNEKLSFFHRGKKLNYQIVHRDNDLIILQLANRKKVRLEVEFKSMDYESQPSCFIIISNDPEIQIIAIEADGYSFGSSFTIVRILQKCFESRLSKLGFNIHINPMYEEKEFWEIVARNSQMIERLKFEFVYPNLPRVNKNLSDELKEASKLLDSQKTNIEFNAAEKEILSNIDSSNRNLESLVKASAAGAGPIKIKLRSSRKWLSTGDKVKNVLIDSEQIKDRTKLLTIIDYIKSLFKDV